MRVVLSSRSFAWRYDSYQGLHVHSTPCNISESWLTKWSGSIGWKRSELKQNVQRSCETRPQKLPQNHGPTYAYKLPLCLCVQVSYSQLVWLHDLIELKPSRNLILFVFSRRTAHLFMCCFGLSCYQVGQFIQRYWYLLHIYYIIMHVVTRERSFQNTRLHRTRRWRLGDHTFAR